MPVKKSATSEQFSRRVLACLCLGGFLLLLTLVLTDHLSGFDDPIRHAFYALRAEGLTPVLIALTQLANKYFLIGLCLLLLILPQTRLPFGVPLSAGSLSTVLINSGIKYLVCRERPDAVLHLVTEHGYSFPSGHSISSMFFYGMAIWLVWHFARTDGQSALSSRPLPLYEKRTAIVLTVLLLIPLVMIGLTRIYLGVHFPSDVLAGWCLAGFLVVVEIEIIEAIERKHSGSVS